MYLFYQLGQSQSTIGMRKPMKIDAEQIRLKFCHVALDVEIGIFQHAVSEIGNLDVVTIALKIGGQAGETDRVHLELVSRRNHVGHWALKHGSFPKVENRGGMQQDEVQTKWILHVGSANHGEPHVVAQIRVNADPIERSVDDTLEEGGCCNRG
jgi:hypothetical protein